GDDRVHRRIHDADEARLADLGAVLGDQDFAGGDEDAGADHQHVREERDAEQPRRLHAADEGHQVGHEQRADRRRARGDHRRVPDQPSFARNQGPAPPRVHSARMPRASELVIDPVLIRSYAVSGPRYPSYPTADRFVEAFGEPQLRQWLAKRNIGGISQPLAVYGHLPFCGTGCYYCRCTKVGTPHHSKTAQYITYFQKELTLP